jgi:sulfatase-modifying factor enzyme 1
MIQYSATCLLLMATVARARVESFAPNGCGLYDMIGNVWGGAQTGTRTEQPWLFRWVRDE